MQKTTLIIVMAALCLIFKVRAQQKPGTVATTVITGKVIAEGDKTPLPGATIAFRYNPKKCRTNEEGTFSTTLSFLPDTMIVSHIGYKVRRMPVNRAKSGPYTIVLEEIKATLTEVTVHTGYYQTAKERATGSFSQVDNLLINRSTSANILDRLEEVTSGLQFNRLDITGENPTGTRPQLRVRGLSTISSGSSPLIIVDNFPYQGDITSINPNDVESVTVLKDAAAASIWGARAGNGVIVINTKRARYNQKPTVNINSSLTLTSKPNLFYDKNYLPSSIVMDIQKQLFNKGAYAEDNLTYLPGYVELLIKKRDHGISDADFESQQFQMTQTDVRQQALRYLYQQGIRQQYAFNTSGGGNTYTYYLSAGYDKDKKNAVGNQDNRMNLSFQNSFKITPALELQASLFYTQQHFQNNKVTYSNLGNNLVQEPYTLLADAQGNALPVGYFRKRSRYLEQAEKNGLLDWQYRPLDEVKLADNTSTSDELRVYTGLKYNFLRYFNVHLSYQYLRGSSKSQSYYHPNSFYARDLINTFTQEDGQLLVPNGGILDGGSPSELQSHSGRAQVNYSRNFTSDHQVTALAGAEVAQQTLTQLPGFRLYDYTRDQLGGSNLFDYTQWYPILPEGNAQIPGPAGGAGRNNSRSLSYFSNAAYTYLDRYIVSGSARWDGSNLLGVKTNQRGTLLWSAGGSWEISKENFYKAGNWLPYLRVRATYGSSGLIDKSQSQYPSIALYADPRTSFPYADLQHPGNPSLRWEQVNTLNFGADWSSKDQRFSGSLEWYHKAAKNLLGSRLIDPTTGALANYKQNYANMNTQGFDLQLNSINLNGQIKWQTSLLLSYTRNKITSFNTPAVSYISAYFNNSTKPPRTGRSLDDLYALPWNGLDHQTGLPIIYKDGKISTNYQAYIDTFKPEDLQVAGLEVSPFFGSLRNTVNYKGIELSAIISFKTGYVFRRTSMVPGGEYLTNDPNLHADYFKRWKNPGDEVFTNVPAAAEYYDTGLATAYTRSAALITSGDHIRLQDVYLSYTLPQTILTKLPFQSVKCYASGQNLGIIWRKNKFGIDPDLPNALYPNPRTIAFGLQIGL